MTGKHARTALFVLALILLAGLGASAQDQSIPKSLVKFATEKLTAIGQDPDIIAFVAAQNAKGVSLARIQELDKAWIAEKGTSPFQKGVLENACSARLEKLLEPYPFILEAFAMDNQGALVGLTHKTSDYWQGDEAKFTESFKGGEGALHFGQPEVDPSVGATVVQISVPVRQAGKAIGAITYGISIESWEKR